MPTIDDLTQITPLILTYNEERNISRCLDRLHWAKRIVVIDSGSTDSTLLALKTYSNVDVHSRRFDNHTNQWNYGLDQVSTEWVLTLDADYICSEELPSELRQVPNSVPYAVSSFRYCIWGKRLRGSLYPQRAILFRPRQLRYIPDGHTQLLDTQNLKPFRLKTKIDHDDRKPLLRWLNAQHSYASLEAEKLLATDRSKLGWKDRIRLIPGLAPFLTVIYCLLRKGLLFSGPPGWFYTAQRVYAELLLSLRILDSKYGTSNNSK